MALTYTIAGLQTQLDAVADAVDASAWASARRSLTKAWLVVSGLPSSVRTDGAELTMRVESALDKAIDEAKDEVNKAADNRRLIRFGVSHATGVRRGV